MAKITNTSDLRKMLVETIDDVRSGKVDPKQAHAIAILSSKVLQSAKLDLEVLKYNALDNNAQKAGESVLQLVASR